MMPFEGGIESTQNGTLVLSVVAAVIYAVVLDTRPSLLRSAVKMLAVGLLAVLAIIQGGPMLLVAALALSAIGDACLSREGDRAFLVGLASFLAAHLLYIALFVSLSLGFDVILVPWRMTMAGVVALLILVMLVLVLRRVSPGLRLPILLYGVAILAMGMAALTQENVLVITGAVLFILADGILAAERYLVSAISPHRPWMRHAAWGLYYTAQLFIALGLLTLA